MDWDSSEERFEKRTLRGKYLRALRDDTEDLRREVEALEFDYVNLGLSEESNSPRSVVSEKNGERKLQKEGESSSETKVLKSKVSSVSGQVKRPGKGGSEGGGDIGAKDEKKRRGGVEKEGEESQGTKHAPQISQKSVLRSPSRSSALESHRKGENGSSVTLSQPETEPKGTTGPKKSSSGIKKRSPSDLHNPNHTKSSQPIRQLSSSSPQSPSDRTSSPLQTSPSQSSIKNAGIQASSASHPTLSPTTPSRTNSRKNTNPDGTSLTSSSIKRKKTPFGTLRSHRRRNVRLLAEIDSETPSSQNQTDSHSQVAASHDSIGDTHTQGTPKNGVSRSHSKRSASRSSSHLNNDPPSYKAATTPLQPSPPSDSPMIASKSSTSLKSKSPPSRRPSSSSRAESTSRASHTPSSTPSTASTGTSIPVNAVRSHLVNLELSDARAKQRDLEVRLAALTSEKKTKETELAAALARIEALELGKVENESEELLTHRATARHLQQSINNFKREAIGLEKLKIAMRDELKMKMRKKHDDSASAASSSSPRSATSDGTTENDDSSDEDYEMRIEAEEGVDFGVLEDSSLDVQVALAERRKRTKRSKSSALTGNGAVLATSEGGKGSPKSKSQLSPSNEASTSSPSGNKTPTKTSKGSKRSGSLSAANGEGGGDSSNALRLPLNGMQSSDSIGGIGSSPSKGSLKKLKGSSSSGLKVVKTNQNVQRIDAISWFKTHYFASCQQNGTQVVDDLVMVLERASVKGRRVVELDLNHYSLESSEIQALSRAFELTRIDMDKALVSPPQGSKDAIVEFSNSFEPVAVDLSHNRLGPFGKCVVDLVQAIGKVVALDVSSNGWISKGAIDFASSFALSSVSFASLVTFKCSDNGLGYKGGIAVLEALEACKSLAVLDIGNNELDDRVAPALASLIQGSPLTTLSIKYNKFKTAGMKRLVGALAQNVSLTDMDFTQCGPGAGEKSKELVEMLESRENVVRLCIGFNKLPATAFVPRFTSFTAKQQRLVHLDLRGIDLPSKAMCQVLDAIAVNVAHSLQELVLNGNVLDAKCLEVLIDYLTRSHTLRSLGLRGCGLPRAPLQELLATVKHSSSLQTLDLSGNNLNHRRILDSLCACIQNTTSLKLLGLAACKLDHAIIGLIGQALQFNKSIEKLHVDGNKLGERGLTDLANGLAGNDILKVISIRSTSISARGLLSFVASITAKTQTEVIDAADNGLPSANHTFRDRIAQFDAVAVKI